MRIVMAGASGFLGTRLIAALRNEDHEIIRLVRRPSASATEISWDPAQDRLDPSALAGADAVINLCGANVGDRRWTDAYRSILRSSRIEPTRLLATTLVEMPADGRPRTLLNMSAVGYYGDTGDRVTTEEHGPGGDFLARLSIEWEASAHLAERAGVRVVTMRTGLPLDPAGGLLKPLLLPWKLGLGGRLGSGRQYVPWVSMADWLAAVRFLLGHAEISGPVNITGPEPVTNAEFGRALGRVLHRPAIWPIPAVALRVVAGGLADQALGSLRVVPKVLTDRGFRFEQPTIDEALAAVFR
jgi:uncharacterized protein (TIGR01777 family)